MNEHVEREASAATQLEVQLTAVKEELARVVAASAADRKANSQMNSEVIQLKHQLQNLEKTRVHLLSENGRFKDEKYKLEDEIKALGLRANQLQGQLSVSTTSFEKVKAEYARELEKLRGDHGVEINRLQRNHERAIEELKTSQKNYLEYLKQETAELQTRGEQSSQQALLAIEDKEIKRTSLHFESMVQTLQSEIDTNEREKQKLVTEVTNHEAQQKSKASRREAEQQLEILQGDNTALQQKLSNLQAQLERLQKQSDSKAQPQVAWQSNQSEIKQTSRQNVSNQDCHENDEIIDQLRTTLKQRDRCDC
eukprot:jgi/Phyca11/531992/estExt2_fgenesh1_pg.C_PHYCAscaffold_30159